MFRHFPLFSFISLLSGKRDISVTKFSICQSAAFCIKPTPCIIKSLGLTADFVYSKYLLVVSVKLGGISALFSLYAVETSSASLSSSSSSSSSWLHVPLMGKRLYRKTARPNLPDCKHNWPKMYNQVQKVLIKYQAPDHVEYMWNLSLNSFNIQCSRIRHQ